MSRWAVLVSALFVLACEREVPRPCDETLAFVESETERIGQEHAGPCALDADCVLVSDDMRCFDGDVALCGCFRAVLASRESDAREALDALRDEMCSTAREPCSSECDCGDEPPACVDNVCVRGVN